MNGLMHRSKLCLFDQLIGADLLRRLSSIFWIEIGSYLILFGAVHYMIGTYRSTS